jgi:hypothetical protein
MTTIGHRSNYGDKQMPRNTLPCAVTAVLSRPGDVIVADAS